MAARPRHTARPPMLLPLVLCIASALQGGAQQAPLPYVYADELGLRSSEEGYRAAQAPQWLGPPFFIQSPFAPLSQLEPFELPPLPPEPESEESEEEPEQSEDADGPPPPPPPPPPPLPPLPPRPKPHLFPSTTQFPPFPNWQQPQLDSQQSEPQPGQFAQSPPPAPDSARPPPPPPTRPHRLPSGGPRPPQRFPSPAQFPPHKQTQLPPFHNWPSAAHLPQYPGGLFPPKLPPGWPLSESGEPLSAIPILSPVPHGFIPVTNGPHLPAALAMQQWAKRPQQQLPHQTPDARSAGADRPWEPAHIYKTVIPTARHHHRPVSTVLFPPPATIVVPSPVHVPQPQPQPQRDWWSYWPPYPWVYLQPYG